MNDGNKRSYILDLTQKKQTLKIFWCYSTSNFNLELDSTTHNKNPKKVLKYI